MREVKIHSDNIKAMFYEPKSETLLVFFIGGSLYSYVDVKNSEVSEIERLGGSYFYKIIRQGKEYLKKY
ncbi:MAG: KTSC domain-containing protein [Cetobacterium sp.]